MARRGSAAIDEAESRKLAMLHCSTEEMAEIASLVRPSVGNNPSDRAAAQDWKLRQDQCGRGQAKGKISLTANSKCGSQEQGNPALAIWLGKQLLGQVDQVSHNINGPQIMIVLPRRTAGSLDELGSRTPVID